MAIPEDRVTAMRSYKRPMMKKGICALLGTTGYYRKFVAGYSQTAKPLTMLTKKDEPVQLCWTPESEQAFLLLRKTSLGCTLMQVEPGLEQC